MPDQGSYRPDDKYITPKRDPYIGYNSSTTIGKD